jgi:hypothetical protein
VWDTLRSNPYTPDRFYATILSAFGRLGRSHTGASRQHCLHARLLIAEHQTDCIGRCSGDRDWSCRNTEPNLDGYRDTGRDRGCWRKL